jgi:hypothetical protein
VARRSSRMACQKSTASMIMRLGYQVAKLTSNIVGTALHRISQVLESSAELQRALNLHMPPQALLLTSWVRFSFYLEALTQHHISVRHVQQSSEQVGLCAVECATRSSPSQPADPGLGSCFTFTRRYQLQTSHSTELFSAL